MIPSQRTLLLLRAWGGVQKRKFHLAHHGPKSQHHHNKGQLAVAEQATEPKTGKRFLRNSSTFGIFRNRTIGGRAFNWRAKCTFEMVAACSKGTNGINKV